jgi:hypothetical protein
MERLQIEVPLYTLDGEFINLSRFLRDNDFSSEEIHSIVHLQPGQEIGFGGGAAALFILKRVS